MSARVDSLDPKIIKRIDIGVVVGKVTVRSCPVAKNITVHTRAYASSDELLNTMVVNIVNDNVAGEFKTSVLAPSFDWRHCQHSWVEVVVPEGSKLDVVVQGILANVEIEGRENALRHITVATKIAYIRARDIETEGSVALSSDIGYISVKALNAKGSIVTRQRVGYLGVKEVTSASLDSELHFGATCSGNINASSVRILSEVAWVNLWNVEARNLTAFVEYGKLSVSPQRNFAGNFSVVSPYGFLHADSSDAVPFNYAKNNEAEIVGFVDTVDTRNFNMASVYGAVNFFVMEPTNEKNRRDD